MKEQILAKTLCPGDLIAVPYNNYLVPAIYKGFGQSVQFYMLSNIEYVKKRIFEGKRPCCAYINRSRENIIAKVSEDELPDHLKKDYEDLFYILKENGYI